MKSGRINYIDSAKGICMLLVMMIHIGVPEPLPNLYNVKVPLFFILSGFFLKDSIVDYKSTLIKSFNRLIIPFLFFYVVSYFLFYVGCAVYPPMRGMTEAQGILDCFTQKQYFNGPLWFLPCLFFVQITVNAVQRITRVEWLRATIIWGLGCIGYLLSVYKIDLPLAMDTALVAIPMFWTGHYLNVVGVFSHPQRWIVIAPICIAVYIISIIPPPNHIAMSVNRYSINFVYLYVLSFSLSILVVYLCKWFLKIDIFTPFIGRNTLFLLCTHHLVYRPVKVIAMSFLGNTIEPYFTFLVTLCVCLIFIPLFNKWIPWAVGKYNQ